MHTHTEELSLLFAARGARKILLQKKKKKKRRRATRRGINTAQMQFRATYGASTLFVLLGVK